MNTVTYESRRSKVEEYFDRTAVKAWEQLTSDAPVGRIRATVRAGRDRMRQQLLDWLPVNLTGMRVLDAGCGTGALALAAALRGAEVVAIDLSPQLVDVARRRVEEEQGTQHMAGHIDWRSGDMLDPSLGNFDYVVAMDSLIHYDETDMARLLASWSLRTKKSMLFTFAPRTPLLATMRSVGRLFPRSNRAPWIEPVKEKSLSSHLDDVVPNFAWSRSHRVSSGFYTSQAVEMVKA